MESRPTRRGLLAGAAALGASACAGTSAAKDELDELFADLTDQSGNYEPIGPQERRARVARLGTILAETHVDALLMEAGPTLAYLSQVSWGKSERLFALVVCADGTSFWICPAFEAPRAEERIETAGGPRGPVIPWDEDEYAFAPLAAALRERKLERVAIEPQTRSFVAMGLAAELGARKVVSGAEVVRRLRGTKDAHELELLRGVNELTQRAIVSVSERLQPGITDYELGGWMRRAQERLGLSNVWVLPLAGPRAAYPHGSPEGHVLENGDLILVDTGGNLHGYKSDNTRTWVFGGPPSEAVAGAWHTVKDAQLRAFEAMRPGVPCREIDRVARQVITDAGFGEGYTSFAHRLGHGIGLEGHEQPYFDGGSEVVLAPGMTFSDEPGIYLPGRFGIRLEDIVAITADGADNFGSWQKSPRSPA